MLAKTFDWNDTKTIYHEVNEHDCEAIGKGRYIFYVTDEKGERYTGSAFEGTVREMTEHVLWRLEAVTSPRGRRIVILPVQATLE